MDDLTLDVWLGTTDSKVFPMNNPTMITDGAVQVVKNMKVDLAEGEGWMKVDFHDTPFVLPEGKNLVVTVGSKEEKMNGNFDTPVQFRIWNSTSSGANYSDEWYHTVAGNGKSEFDLNNNQLKCYGWEDVPFLHIALKGNDVSGVTSVEKAETLGVAVSGRAAMLRGAAERLEAYDMQGRKVMSLRVEGKSRVALPLGSGVYVLRAMDAAGNTAVAKVAIR